jgi:hypothetical protein
LNLKYDILVSKCGFHMGQLVQAIERERFERAEVEANAARADAVANAVAEAAAAAAFAAFTAAAAAEDAAEKAEARAAREAAALNAIIDALRRELKAATREVADLRIELAESS